MRTNIHRNYDLLTNNERNFVDDCFRRVFKAASTFNVRIVGDDRIERAVDALALAVLESRPAAKPLGPVENVGSNFSSGHAKALGK